MGEARNSTEGTLAWVQASGSGKTFATASAPASAVFGFAENFRFASAVDRAVIMDRGIPSHYKLNSRTVIDWSCDVLYANTGEWPMLWTTASGSTTPMGHLQLKMTAPEMGSSLYYVLIGAALDSFEFTETTPANKLALKGRALAMSGVNTSGLW